MNANTKNSWNRLPKKEQDLIIKTIRNSVYDEVDEQLYDTQIAWIKINCCIMWDCGCTIEQITQMIGLWKTYYRANSRFITTEEQENFINPKLEKVFGPGGFPYEEFVQNFKRIGR